MRLIRAAIYLGVIAFLLPSPPEQPAAQNAALGMAGAAPAPGASNGDLLAAAVDAVDDVSGFCTRQPTVCDTARILLVKLEAKAKYGMRLIYQWAETPEPATPPAAGTEAKLGDPITTSTVAGDQHPAKDALRPADLRPKWRPPKRSGAG
jgi:hypothetical protein